MAGRDHDLDRQVALKVASDSHRQVATGAALPGLAGALLQTLASSKSTGGQMADEIKYTGTVAVSSNAGKWPSCRPAQTLVLTSDFRSTHGFRRQLDWLVRWRSETSNRNAPQSLLFMLISLIPATDSRGRQPVIPKEGGHVSGGLCSGSERSGAGIQLWV